MQSSFTKLIAASVILVNSQLIFAKNRPNYPEGFSPKKTGGIAFTENKGQVYDQNHKPRPDVLYGAMTGNMAFHLRNNGVSYQLFRVDKWRQEADEHMSTNSVFSEKSVAQSVTKGAALSLPKGAALSLPKGKEIDQQSIYRIDLNWVNANRNFTSTTDQTLEGCSNYYLESCPNGALNVKSYTGITLHNLYDGINLHYYENNGQLKHDYIVAPNTDYKQIQLQVEGAEITLNKDGSLLLGTPLGKIQEGAPIVYQNGKILKAKWVIKTSGEQTALSLSKGSSTTSGEVSQTIGFEVENYNPTQELIIDPVTRLWGTYYGDAVFDQDHSCATDATGNVYLAGYTNSNTGTIIATVGAHQAVYGGFNSQDAFLVKFNSNGVRQWGTYYGGTGTDLGLCCATDATGNVYLTGRTSSNGNAIIATAGAHQTVLGGGQDAFLVKFNSSGVRQWGTYYGGSGGDRGNSCVTDASGNVYMAGFTTSSLAGTLIATAGAHQPAYGGGTYDAFLVKFNSNGVRQWGTYYGGNGNNDLGNSCVADALGNVYLAGNTDTNTGTVIATAGAHQSVNNSNDAFIVQFNANGVRQWATYYGGTGAEEGNSCSIDAAANVYLAGTTDSNIGTVIATPGSHQPVFGAGLGSNAFLVKFNSSGLRQWGTYYGGGGNERGLSCVADVTGNVHLAGITDSNIGTAIATVGAHQTTFGGNTDAFIVQFNSNGIRQWGTYYGGTGTEEGYSCAADLTGNVYLAGNTDSNASNVIATVGAHQTVYGGGQDAFLVKLFGCASLSPTVTTGALCMGTTINLSVSITGTATPTYLWAGPNSFTAVVQNPSIANAGTIHTGAYTVSITTAACVETVTTVINTINPLPSITILSSSTNYICIGQTANLTASGATSYTWNSNATTAGIAVSPSTTTTYTVTGTDNNGCVNNSTFTQNVNACTGINEKHNALSVVEVYPNPNNGEFTILSPSDIRLSFINELGQVVKTISLKANTERKVLINEMANGIYFVVGQSNNQVIKQKIIVNK